MIEKYPIDWMHDHVDHFADFLNNYTIAPIFEAGGIIAGGAVRYMLRHGTISSMKNYFQRVDHPAGDIDAFFPDKSCVNDCIARISSPYWYPSRGGGATQCQRQFSLKGVCTENIILQLVTCRYGTPEETLSTFDFANCKAAFNRTHVWIDDRLIDLEKKKTLVIDDVEGPMLAPRVIKYFQRHDYDMLDQASRTVIIEWMLNRLNSGNWGKVIMKNRLVGPLIRLGANVISDQDLVYFIGKSREIVSMGYRQPKKHVDVAVQEIIKRNNETQDINLDVNQVSRTI